MGEVLKLPIGELFEIEKGSLQSLKNSQGEYDFITAAEEWKTHDEFSHDMEALIFAAAASGSLGRTHYVNGKFITSDLCYILIPKSSEKYPIDLKFYHFVFNSFKDEIVKETKSGTSKEAINQKSFKSYNLPYFHIEKQHFWIQKLINTKQYQQALLSEFSYQIQCVSKLRQSILQEAIEGKLTTQWRKENPHIEPASVLLQKIQDEQERLARDGKIKKSKLIAQIKEDEISFELPPSWKWCRLKNITEIKGGKRVSNGYKLLKTPTPYVYIRVSDMKNNTIDDSDLHYIDEKMHEQIKRYIISKDDLYMVIVGGTIGKCGIIPEKFDGMNLTENAAKIILYETDKNFLLRCLNSNYCQKQFVDKTKQVGVQKMALNRFESTILPLPPKEEQKAIVKKIETLFAMCDEIEQDIYKSKANVEMLMKAVLKEAFE